MSFSITEAMVVDFALNVQILAEQDGTRLRPTVMYQPVTGRTFTVNRVTGGEAEEKTTRHSDTPTPTDEHSVRHGRVAPRRRTSLFDLEDDPQIILTPMNSYQVLHANAMNRAVDDYIIKAADATVVTGVDSDGTAPFPSAQNIASGSTGMSVDKIIDAMTILGENEVSQMMPWTIVYGAQQLKDLLNDSRVTSKDFNQAEVLRRGVIDDYLGFRHVRSQRLALNDSGERKCFAYAMGAITLGIAKEPTTLSGTRTDKDHGWQLYTYMVGGAVRTEEELIVRINCTF